MYKVRSVAGNQHVCTKSGVCVNEAGLCQVRSTAIIKRSVMCMVSNKTNVVPCVWLSIKYVCTNSGKWVN